MADVALERVSGRLCREYQHRVALAVSLESVLCEPAKGVVAECLPELVDTDNHPLAGQELVDTVEEIQHNRRADVGIVEKVGHVETDEPGVQSH